MVWSRLALNVQSSLIWWLIEANAVPELRSQRVQDGEKLVETGRLASVPSVLKRGMAPQTGALGAFFWRW